MKILTVLLFSCLNFSAYSQYDDKREWSENVQEIIDSFELIKENIIDEYLVERIIPYSKQESLIAIPVYKVNEEDFYSCNLYVVIINNSSKKITSSYFREEAISSDAMRFKGLEIDFAPYKLNEKTRAFGIRFKYEGSSKPSPYADSYITLFIKKGNKLFPVLNSFAIYRYSGIWDMNCNGEFEQEKKVIVLSESQTNGYRDLILKSTINHIRSFPKGEECLDKIKSEFKQQVLKYGNGGYK